MKRISLTALIVVVGCSFVSSGILHGPIRGYSTSFASSQTQKYDSRKGYFSDVTVTSRQCSVIRRLTRYMKERVPFLCQATTGRVVPLPPTQSNNAQLMQAMKAGGWTMCSKAIKLPIHQLQRIPVCCPGTVPTRNGGCLNKNAAATVNKARSRQALPPPMHQGQPQDPRMAQPVSPIPLIVKAPRPYRAMMNRVPARGVGPSLLQQVMFPRGRAGPSYTTDSRGNPNMNHMVGVPRPPMVRRPVQDGPPRSEWQSELARFVAAMMYHKMLADHAEKRLQDEFDRQNRIRQQIELAMAQHIYMLQQQKKKQQQQQRLMERQKLTTTTLKTTPSPTSDSDSDSDPAPGPGPSPAPAPPVQTDVDATPNQQVPEGETEPGQPNGNVPQAPPKPPHVMMAEMKVNLKNVVDSCLAKAGLSTSIEIIIRSGDLIRLKPICGARDAVGPCIMTEAGKVLGQDQVSMVGRRLVQSVLLSLGQLCIRLEKATQMTSGPVMTPPKMTSAPVFPNPAPSMTKPEVTAGPVKVEKSNPPETQKKDREEVRPVAKPLEEPPMPQATPTTPTKHEAHSHHMEKKEQKEAAFPMWMILTMVGACAALLLFCCMTVCLVVRCRRKRKEVELDRQPEKLPVPAEGNFYAAAPCVAPPAYNTTAVKQTMGGENGAMEDYDFKIPEDDVKEEDKEEKEEEKGGAHP